MARSSKSSVHVSSSRGGGGGGTYSNRHGSHLLWVYGPPWAIWLGAMVVGAVAHLLWGGNLSAIPWFSIAAFAFTIGFPIYLWRLTRPRGPILQWLAVVSGAAAGLWILLAGLFGPFTRPLPDLWFGTGAVSCVVWNARRAVMNGAREDQESEGGATTQADKFMEVLDGARVRKPKELEAGGVGAELELARGDQRLKDLQGKIEVLEGVLGIRKGAIRVTGNPKDAGLADMVVYADDPLEGELVWPGPSAPGKSVAVPFPIGRHEDGVTAQIWLTGDDKLGRAFTMWLIMGMTGAGKTQAMLVLVADVLTRTEAVVWGSDHVKGRQTLAPVLPGLDWAVMTKKGAKAMLAAARRVVTARAGWLGDRGFEQWEPGCGIPLLIVWIEEATALVSDSSTFTGLVREARSVGVIIMVSLQRAAHTAIDTDARAQIGANWCFGVRDHTDAGFALPDDVLDAGAAPENWQNRKAGYSYVVAPGIPEERWPVAMRSWRGRRDALAAAVLEWAHVRWPLDDVSIAAAGADYKQDFAGDQPALARGAREDDMDDYDGPDDMDDEEFPDDDMEPMPPPLDPHIYADPDQPIAPPEVDLPLEGALDPGKPQLSTEQAQAVVQQHLRALLAGGENYTKPAHIAVMRPPTTRSREWIRLELIRLADTPEDWEYHLERDEEDPPGVYRILAPLSEMAGAR